VSPGDVVLADWFILVAVMVWLVVAVAGVVLLLRQVRVARRRVLAVRAGDEHPASVLIAERNVEEARIIGAVFGLFTVVALARLSYYRDWSVLVATLIAVGSVIAGVSALALLFISRWRKEWSDGAIDEILKLHPLDKETQP